MSKIIVAALLIAAALFMAAPILGADEMPNSLLFDSLPPSVVKTAPQCGDVTVDPGLKEISVTFSKEMKVTGHCWSWCSVQDDSFPKLDGKTEFLSDNRTCVLHVALEPNKTYGIWINVDKFQSFQDKDFHPAVPYLLVFKTRAE